MSTINPFTNEIGHYQILFENVSQAIQINQIIFNENGEPVDYLILDVNHAFEKCLGLKKEEIIGKRLRDFFPDAKQEWFIRYGEVVKTGKTARFEMYGVSFDKWFDVEVVTLGTNNEFGILFQDITKSKCVEEALKNSEHRLRIATKAAGMYSWEVDVLTGDIRFFGEVRDVIGFSYTEYKDVFSLIDRFTLLDENFLHKEALQSTMRGDGDLHTINRIINPDTGENVWLESYATLVSIKEGIQRVVGITRNITDRKKIEIEKEHYMELAEERADWRQAILDLIPAGVWISDNTGKVVLTNKEAINMYRGISPLSGSLEEYTSYKLFKHGTDEPINLEPYVPKEALNSVILDFERFDGTRGTQVASTEALRDKDGNIINYVAVSMDITPLIQAQKAQKKSEKIAMELVEKLRMSNKRKNDFINMLSHELRNPLASIMMGIELMEKSPPGGKQATKALGILKRQGRILNNLVDDLLDATRITQNKVSLKKETVEINDLINKAVQDYQLQFIDKGVKLEVKLDVPLYIEADYTRLTQVICNLLHNAVKFTDKNDLVIVSVTQDTNKGEVIITVEDTGRGIDPKDQLNLFKPFMQVDKSLDRSLGGLGLGLVIVKGMVELHGGRVEAFSEGLGKGTKFTIRLPF